MFSRRLFASLAIASALVGCSKPAPSGSSALTVAATAVPHAEILEFVKPALAKQGVELNIKVFNDYVQPNLVVDQKQADANYFETKPYLDQFNQSRGTHLVTVIGVHVEPLGAYSKKHKTIAELPDGATVALPNEASNEGRALLLLQKAGLVTLKDPANPLATLKDVIANPKHLQFKELEGATLPRILDQVDLALINTNYALDAKLEPTRDALIIEGKDSPYVNFLVARPDNKDDPRIRKLAAALTSPEVKAFIASKYKGAVLPAF
jgi:D-methionine transport system substrate-binding protein